jgi:hypothetical protein
MGPAPHVASTQTRVIHAALFSVTQDIHPHAHAHAHTDTRAGGHACMYMCTRAHKTPHATAQSMFTHEVWAL